MTVKSVMTVEGEMNHYRRLVNAVRGLRQCRLYYAWSTGGALALERAITWAETVERGHESKDHPGSGR